jgi:hypothetical protein
MLANMPNNNIVMCNKGQCMVLLVEDISKRESSIPASEEEISEAEKNIGFQFPPLLRQVYLESWFQGWLNGDDLWAETYGT